LTQSLEGLLHPDGLLRAAGRSILTACSRRLSVVKCSLRSLDPSASLRASSRRQLSPHGPGSSG